MTIWGLARQFSFKQLFRLSLLVLQKPFFINPTLKATRRTMSICNSLYANSHHKNGRANAFRHALWNILICQNVFKITQNEEKSLIWTQKITDLHEKLIPNEPLAELMDLHNNEIGRKHFSLLKNNSEERIISFLKECAVKAKKISEIEEAKNYKNDLVYILEA